jgi:hypothetical protein
MLMTTHRITADSGAPFALHRVTAVAEAFTCRADYEGGGGSHQLASTRWGPASSRSWRPADRAQRAQRVPAPESEARDVNASATVITHRRKCGT